MSAPLIHAGALCGLALAGPEPIALDLLATNLATPVSVAFAPGDTDRVFVVEKIGRVRVYRHSLGHVSPVAFLDITDDVLPIGERGLLDVAFDPDHATNGYVYAAFNHDGTSDMTISRFSLSPDPNVVDPSTEQVLFEITDYLGHNGGQLRFGPDGLLYFAAGDGSNPSENDPENNAQDLSSAHGKILRLDPALPPPHVPPSNPFVGVPGAVEQVWGLGLRNPWRFSFDRVTGDLYIADVGRAVSEEINFQPAASVGGENYGWRCLEGTACTPYGGCTCTDTSLVSPALEIAHGVGSCAVIGGYVYRGTAIASLAGRYLYSDYCGAPLLSFVPTPAAGTITPTDLQDHSTEADPLGELTLITSFGEDPSGELYITSRLGQLWQIVPLAGVDCDSDGVVDRVATAQGSAPDCNANGIPDACDIAAGTSNDCDLNGIPDECEFAIETTLISPALAPIGDGFAPTHMFTGPPTALAPVTITVRASADLNADNEWIDVLLNGSLVGTVFQDFGVFCPVTPPSESFTIGAALFNSLVGGGDAEIMLVTGEKVSAAECGASQATVTIDYLTLDPEADTDGSGIPDLCECDADLAPPIGLLDFFDVLAFLSLLDAQDPGADLAPPFGTFDFFDVLAYLSLFDAGCD